MSASPKRSGEWQGSVHEGGATSADDSEESGGADTARVLTLLVRVLTLLGMCTAAAASGAANEAKGALLARAAATARAAAAAGAGAGAGAGFAAARPLLRGSSVAASASAVASCTTGGHEYCARLAAGRTTGGALTTLGSPNKLVPDALAAFGSVEAMPRSAKRSFAVFDMKKEGGGRQSLLGLGAGREEFSLRRFSLLPPSDPPRLASRSKKQPW